MDGAYELLLARLRSLEADVAALRERLQEIEDDLQEAWLGGTD